ncbi:MAG TPA: hypothetical protein VGQ12_10095 [Candidatus Angelobacter sp.]|nr:hypothetical protein [Candidatus Angelobacter sp.]
MNRRPPGRLFYFLIDLVLLFASLIGGVGGELALHDTEMEFLNEVQQFGAHAGGHKGAAGLAG